MNNGIRRRDFLRTAAVAVASAGALKSIGAEAARERMNVLFIAVDDLRPELGCYGARHIKSPNIDKLAAGGLLFNRAYCQQAICSPSRTSLMTGARPDTTRVYNLDTHFRETIPDVVTLPQHFMKNGYFAQGMGKIYHGSLNDEKSWSVPWVLGGKPPAPALPRWSGYFNKETIGWLKKANAKLQIKRRELVKKLGRRLKYREGRKFRVNGPAYEAPDVPDSQVRDGATARLGVATLKKLKGKKEPFFLAVGFLKPHLPFVAPKKYWDMYDRKKIGLAPNRFAPEGAYSWSLTTYGELRNYKDMPQGKEKIPDDLAITLRHGYFACCSFTDANVGLLLDALDKLGLKGNTIVILWGDHGWKLGDHDCWCKHTNFEIDTRVPMIIRVPKQKNPGAKTEALVEFVDIYPSLCELCGLPLPPHLEGTSFAPLIDDPKRPWKKAAFSQYPRRGMMGYTIATDRYRFVEWLKRGVKLENAPKGDAELYDHKTDPLENRNIANKSENAELAKKMRALLRKGWKGALPPA
ncbi:MAG: sulfatase [Phycisphaerae bacterium]|nr:sulfatase [Planctomycetota bacterium]MBL7219168.1 sulfatase [Phycisphaerae bacterium]